MLQLETGSGAAERLAAALGAARIASVVLIAPAGRTLEASSCRPLLDAVQAAGAAALISGDAALARVLKADGVHIPVSEKAEMLYRGAREVLDRRAIVGLDAGRSRHDAMVIGESDADYIGFGIPDFVKDRDAAIARRLELVQWWAEIFEVPCVAFDVMTPDEAHTLADVGADFVCVTVGSGMSLTETAERLAAFASALGASATAQGA